MSQNCSCNMKDYLKTTIENLRCGNYAALTVVLGNESCDLDSAVCALVYAAFLHWQHQKMKCKVCTRNKRTEPQKDEIFAPILNVAREDFPLKTEVVACLDRHGLGADDLLFKDDHNLETLLTPPSRVILVDHHVLTSGRHLAPLVSEIIDHRPVDRSHWTYADDTRSTIEPVGSCATLVAQRIVDLSALFAKDVDFFMADRVSCDLLHSAIILDTVNFSNAVKKGTPHDEEMVQLLETILQPDDYVEERAAKLSWLVSSRGAVSALSPAQILRKDVKSAGDILVPSLPILVKEFLSLPGGVSAVLATLATPSSPGGMVLLGMELSGGLRRDAAVCCLEAGRRDQLCASLQAWRPSLDLSEDVSPDRASDSIRYFTQGNLSASRKQYMPALEHFLNQ